MKCPECGEELNKSHVCKSCGRNIKGSAEEFEVEYKEFKLSEFLEIRRKRGKKSLKDYGKREKNIQKASVDKKKTLFKSEKDTNSIKNKKFFIILLVSIIGLALISGLILLDVISFNLESIKELRVKIHFTKYFDLYILSII